ncbi:MAG: type II toxin-antitoxin system HicB family antitoxin [Verrucomicrobiota bacterium]
MDSGFTAIIRQDGDWWIGWVEEVPGVNAQEKTRKELLEALCEALNDIIELNREEARKLISGEFEEVPIPA